MNNFVKFYRSLTQLWWYKDTSLRLVMMHLILTANHSDVKMPNVLVKRGALVSSRSKLCAQIGLTDHVLRRCLSQLESAGEISKMSIKKTSKTGTLITICNYDSYVGEKTAKPSKKAGKTVQDASKITSKIIKTKNRQQNTDNKTITNMENKETVQDASKITSTNKNNIVRINSSKEEYNTHVVGAQARESWKALCPTKEKEVEMVKSIFFSEQYRGAFEQICMSLHCTPDEFKEIANEIFAEWIITGEDVKDGYNAAAKHLIAQSRIKIAEKRRAAAKQPPRTTEQWHQDMQAHILKKIYSN